VLIAFVDAASTYDEAQIAINGDEGSALYVGDYPGGAWKYGVDKTGTTVVADNDTLHARTSDGAWEVNAQSMTISSDTNAFTSGSSLTFKQFWQQTLNKINGLFSSKQNKITASGMLKGDGAGGVTAATAGTDYSIISVPVDVTQGGTGSTTAASAMTILSGGSGAPNLITELKKISG